MLGITVHLCTPASESDPWGGHASVVHKQGVNVSRLMSAERRGGVDGNYEQVLTRVT